MGSRIVDTPGEGGGKESLRCSAPVDFCGDWVHTTLRLESVVKPYALWLP